MRRCDDQAARFAHFPMQQTHGVLFVIVRPERVGTHHLAQIAGLVGEGFDLGAHFVDHDGHAPICGLPCCLGPGHAAADDMKFLCHGADVVCQRGFVTSLIGRDKAQSAQIDADPGFKQFFGREG